MRVGKWLAWFVAMASAACGLAHAAAPPRPVEVHVDYFGGDEASGQFLLRTFDDNIFYVLPMADIAPGQDARKIIEAAIDTHHEMLLSFDWAAATIDQDKHHLIFPICALRFDEMVAAIAPPCPRPRSSLKPGLVALAEASAHILLGNTSSALDGYNRAIASSDLDPAWQAVARNARGGTLGNLANDEPPASIEQDHLYLASLDDYRFVDQQSPTIESKKNLAYTYASLGAYAEARRTLQALVSLPGKDEAEADFMVAIGQAAIARLESKPQEALDTLNAMFARRAGLAGMKFYYHRARTLMMLGRADEAVADIAEGLKSQPDYGFAYVMRGCAHAQLGEMALAGDDYRVGLGKLDFPSNDKSVIKDRATISTMIGIADSAAADRTPRPGMCRAMSGKMDEHRDRSPLLPAAVN